MEFKNKYESPGLVSKEFVKALREADHIYVYLEARKNEDGTRSRSCAHCLNYVEFSKIDKPKRDKIFSAKPHDENDRMRARFYGFNGWLDHSEKKATHRTNPSFAGWFMMYAKQQGAVTAMKAILRPGDEIEFEHAENGNGYLDAACVLVENFPEDERHWHEDRQPLHHDELRITIKRKGKTIVNRMVLDDQICPDNSARNLRF